MAAVMAAAASDTISEFWVAAHSGISGSPFETPRTSQNVNTPAGRARARASVPTIAASAAHFHLPSLAALGRRAEPAPAR